MKQKAKIGDIIQWDEYTNLRVFKTATLKTFEGVVAVVNEERQAYGVYADRGACYIPFEDAKIVLES